MNMVKCAFPNEKIEYLSRGAWSVAFRTASGKIIRTKPFFFGTYTRERRILEFIDAHGGIGCRIPKLTTFTRGISAFSIHDDLGGKILSGVAPDFYAAPVAVQKKLATDLYKCMTRLYKMGPIADPAIFKCIRGPGAVNIIQRWPILRKYLDNPARVWELYRITKNMPDFGIIHGDIHNGNILVDDNFKLIGLIDFGNAGIGHIEYDFRMIPENMLAMMPSPPNPEIHKFYSGWFYAHLLRKRPEKTWISKMRNFFT
jgi:hypothetical protein